MRHSILTMTLMFGLGAACALVLRLPWSGVGTPQVQESAHSPVPATAAQLGDLAQRLEALEPRIQGLDRGLKTAAALSETQGEQLGTLSQGLGVGLKRLDPLVPRLESVETQVTRLEPLVPRLESVETQVTRLDPLLPRLESVETQVARLDPLAPRLESLALRVARTETALQRHETRIEEGSVKLFETLMTMNDAGQGGPRMPSGVGSARRPPAADANRPEPAASGAPSPAGSLVLILGLLMPLGAILFAAGGGQPPGPPPAGAPAPCTPRADPDGHYLRAWLGAGLGYAVLGFGLMFGTTHGGWFGAPLQFLPDLWRAGAAQAAAGPLTRLTLELPLAGAAGLILCSALPGRLSPLGQWVTALLSGALVYPLFGHWAGAQLLSMDNRGWLAGIGFADPTGSAGIAALAGVTGLVLASRLGRGEPAVGPRPGGTGAGALLLWLAWLGLALARRAGAEGLAPLVLASGAGAAGAALAVLIVGTLLTTGGGWERRLPAALPAGAVAAPAAAGSASVLGLLLLGLVTGALYAGVLKVMARRFGVAAELPCSFAAAGVCGTMAPAILGPAGFLSVQLLGLVTVLALAWAAGLLLAQLPQWWAPLRLAADRAG